jgi:hypothetical protein
LQSRVSVIPEWISQDGQGKLTAPRKSPGWPLSGASNRRPKDTSGGIIQRCPLPDHSVAVSDLPKVQWFSGLVAANEHEDQPSNSYRQDAADKN